MLTKGGAPELKGLSNETISALTDLLSGDFL